MELVEGPRDPRQQQQSHNPATSRYGHRSRLDDVAAADRDRILQTLCSESVKKCAINGRLDAISSISSVMQSLSAGTAEAAKPYKIIYLIPKSWDGSHEKGQFRKFMAELHLWMQAWSDHLVKVEGVDKVER